VRKVDDYAGDNDLRSDVVLIRVRSEDVDTGALSCGIEDSKSGGIGILEDYVCVAIHQGKRLFFTRAHIIPRAEV
jgi:hypothetical protein